MSKAHKRKQEVEQKKFVEQSGPQVRLKMDFEAVREFIRAQPEESKIYLGCDSERLRINRVWYADYIIAIVVHLNGKNGCKIFGEIVRERDYDQKASKPNTRLMTEVFKVSETYLKLADVLEDRECEIHLDLNPQEIHNSNAVLAQAVGYIRGTCNIVPMVKPSAWAASYAADRVATWAPGFTKP